jgi:hypothetical protein
MREWLIDFPDQYRSLGYERLENGAELIGRAPHVAPHAWLHQRFAALDAASISALTRSLDRALPPAYQQFLEIANGLNLFSTSLCFLGAVDYMKREGPYRWQPFDIVLPNRLERPPHLGEDALVVAAYSHDGSQLSIDGGGRVSRLQRKSGEVLNIWPTLLSLLQSELTRLAMLFDASGRRLAHLGPTTPRPDGAER